MHQRPYLKMADFIKAASGPDWYEAAITMLDEKLSDDLNRSERESFLTLRAHACNKAKDRAAEISTLEQILALYTPEEDRFGVILMRIRRQQTSPDAAVFLPEILNPLPELTLTPDPHGEEAVAEFALNTDGEPENVQLSGVDEAEIERAVDAVRSMRFAPLIYEGAPVRISRLVMPLTP